MVVENLIKKCCADLIEKHDCHTVILYGSFARGDGTEASDIDMAGFSSLVTEKKRDARLFEGRYLDLFIFPERMLKNPDESLLYMRGAKILAEKENAGKEFLEQLEKVFSKGPKKISEDEKTARRVWARKMIDRAKIGDLEGLYRESCLKTTLLEDYFALRDLWYLGSKQSFNWLSKNDAKTYKQFERVFGISSTKADLEKLVEFVVGLRDK